MTFRISLDSSIFISQLTGDVHAEAVLTALTVLETMGAELTLPLLCYAELYTGVELLPEADRPVAAETLERVLRASRVLLVADNVAIAREAARVQAAYRRRGQAGGTDSRFCDRCQCHLLCGAVIDDQSPGLLQGLFYPGGPYTAGVSSTVYPCTTSTREARVNSPGVCLACGSPSHVVHCV